MKKDNKKKYLLGILLLLVFVLAGSYTYARYATEFTGKGTVEVAKWAVKLTSGGTEITEDTAITLTVAENANVASGKMAPSVAATGTLVLDPTGSEVAIDYTVKIDNSNLKDGMAIKSVTANGTELTKDASDEYTGSLSLAEVESSTQVTLVITVEWANNEANNASDTEIGMTANSLEIPVVVTAKQHIA